MVLRLLITISAAYYAFYLYEQGDRRLLYIAIGIAFVHNPIIPLGIGNKVVWAFINFGSVGFFWYFKVVLDQIEIDDTYGQGAYERLNNQVSSHHVSSDSHAVEEKSIYQRVVEEIKRGDADKALYAQALAETQGDKDKAKAYYLRVRAKQIKQEEALKSLHERQAAEQAERNRLAEEKRRKEEERQIQITKLLEESRQLDRRRRHRRLFVYVAPLFVSIIVAGKEYFGVDRPYYNIPAVETFHFASAIRTFPLIYGVLVLLFALVSYLVFRKVYALEKTLVESLAELDSKLARKEQKKRLSGLFIVIMSLLASTNGAELLSKHINTDGGNVDLLIAAEMLKRGEPGYEKRALRSYEKKNALAAIVLASHSMDLGNYDKSLMYARSAREWGNSADKDVASFIIALHYLDGLGVEHNNQKVKELANSIKGSPLRTSWRRDALLGLVNSFLYAEEGKYDSALSSKHLRNLIDAQPTVENSPLVLNAFQAKGKAVYGVMILDQDVPDVERSEAFAYLRSAADNDEPLAFYGLAICYEDGIGTDIDLTKAVEYYVRAGKEASAPDGFAKAAYILIPESPIEDFSRAMNLLHVGVQEGSTYAIDLLADLVASDALPDGHDKIDSIALLILARDQGYKSEQIDAIEKKLSATDFKEVVNRMSTMKAQ